MIAGVMTAQELEVCWEVDGVLLAGAGLAQAGAGWVEAMGPPHGRWYLHHAKQRSACVISAVQVKQVSVPCIHPRGEDQGWQGTFTSMNAPMNV